MIRWSYHQLIILLLVLLHGWAVLSLWGYVRGYRATPVQGETPILDLPYIVECDVQDVHTASLQPPTVQGAGQQWCYLDASKQYKYLPDAVQSSHSRDGSVVCLSSQTSVDTLFWVSTLADAWTGPMSVAVFAPGVDYHVASLMIDVLRHCSARVREDVTFHFVYPVDLLPRPVQHDVRDCSCSELEKCNNLLVHKLRSQSFGKKISQMKYPQNLLRNIAREECWSEFSFTIDIDMVPTPGVYDNLLQFLAEPSADACELCAYILPTYEIIHNATNPHNKSELLTYIKEKKAQPFHIYVFAQNQQNSNLSRWVNESSADGDGLNVLYNITTWQEYWEPVYIARTSSLPRYDERFVGYGFTRNSQALEMEVAGFSWYMLDSVFLAHRGFQTTKMRSLQRKRQMAANKSKYRLFKQDIFKRYKIETNDRRFITKRKSKQRRS